MVESIGKLGRQFQMLLRHNNFYIIFLKYTQNSYESLTLPAESAGIRECASKKARFPKVAE